MRYNGVSKRDLHKTPKSCYRCAWSYLMDSSFFDAKNAEKRSAPQNTLRSSNIRYHDIDLAISVALLGLSSIA